MGIDLSKLKKSTTNQESNSPRKKISLSKLKKDTPAPIEEKRSVGSISNKDQLIKPQEDPNISSDGITSITTQPGFNLSYVPGKTYDLDEIIQIKLRDNTNATLVLRTLTNEDLKAKLIEHVTKKILSDYNVEYNDDKNSDLYYTKRINEVVHFNRIFDIYFNRYYDEYYKIVTSDGHLGSISIDSVLREINLTKEDIRRYNLDDVDLNQDKFLTISDREKPVVIWTDGTPDGSHTDTVDLLAQRIEKLEQELEKLTTK